MPYADAREVQVWGGEVRTQVLVGGEGPPLLFLHNALGLVWDPFLDSLAEHHTVYAPFLPGTAPGDPDAHKAVVDNWDLTLVYDEIRAALGLGRTAVVGHSFGGMLAAELAATFPASVDRLVLISPVGLWTEGRVFNNPGVLDLSQLAAHAFANPTGPVAQATLALPEEPEEMAAAVIGIQWALGVSAKYWWPIPDRGLTRRIHRITSPTLVVWGAADRIIDPAYADDFARLIPGSRAEVLAGAAHLPQLERLDAVAPMIEQFLRG